MIFFVLALCLIILLYVTGLAFLIPGLILLTVVWIAIRVETIWDKVNNRIKPEQTEPDPSARQKFIDGLRKELGK